jgi:hypothetical protein
METNTDAPRIIDSHCHIASLDHIPKSFVLGSIENMIRTLSSNGINVSASRLADTYYQKLQDPLCDTLVAEMDEAGVAKSVLLAADFSYALRDCALTVEESFYRHRDVLQKHPGRFEVFAGIDPRWGKDGLALFERSITEFGFRGFKVYPPCGFSPSDPALFPFYEICSHYRLPVVVHIGPTSPALAFDTSNPFLIDVAASRFPAVNFILAHGAVSFAEECAMLCRFRPNIYLDISAYQITLGWDSLSSAVRKTVSQALNHKILFGTDWPVFRLQGTQKTFVDAVASETGAFSDLSERDRSHILHGNIERLLSNFAGLPAGQPEEMAVTREG